MVGVKKRLPLDMICSCVCGLCLQELCLLHYLAEAGAYYYYSAAGRAAAGEGHQVAKPARAYDRHSASRLPPATKP